MRHKNHHSYAGFRQVVEKRSEDVKIGQELTVLEAAKHEITCLRHSIAQLEEEHEILKKQLAFSPDKILYF